MSQNFIKKNSILPSMSDDKNNRLGRSTQKFDKSEIISIQPIKDQSNNQALIMNSIDVFDYENLNELDTDESEIKIKDKSKLKPLFSSSKTKALRISDILKLSFLNTHLKLLECEFDCQLSGTTCTSIIISESKAYLANVGDSRIIVGRSSSSGLCIARQLTWDHKPNSSGEYSRILANQGRVFQWQDKNNSPIGPHRVWHPDHDYPGLAMSRSLGDFVAHDYGVSEEPDVLSYTIDKDDKFIILASDGIWEFLTNQQVVDTVDKYIHESWRTAADELIEKAYNQWVSNN